jgi:hypothetical protein
LTSEERLFLTSGNFENAEAKIKAGSKPIIAKNTIATGDAIPEEVLT